MGEAWNPLRKPAPWAEGSRKRRFFQVLSTSGRKVLQKPHFWRWGVLVKSEPILSFMKVCICLKFLGGMAQSAGT